MTPILIRNERTWRCFAGAIAAPAGREAALPLTLPACAAAVPVGSTIALLEDAVEGGAVGASGLTGVLVAPGLSGRWLRLMISWEALSSCCSRSAVGGC